VHRDPGPHPAVRALVGLLLGATLGAIVALLLPRERDAAASGEPAAEGGER
jgi:hypothetical protein